MKERVEMSTLVLESMQWADLDHIADVRPIDDQDADCLEEVRLVLQKHDALERFGIALLHSHFDLAEDEMMLETTDAERREHTVRPVRRSYPDDNGFTAQTTIVRFDEHGYSQNCGCDPRTSGHHHK
jgi:isocitrate dehydrogenase kinase/phosphatase